MRKIFILIFLITCWKADAQQFFNDYLRYYPLLKDSSDQNLPSFIASTGTFSMNSNAITNTFIKSFAYGDFIDNELKDKVDSRLKDVNRYGYQLDLSLYGQAALKEKFAIMAGISARQQNSARFSRDMFNIFFRGNKPFAGKTADLDPFNFYSYDYQTFSVGFQSKSLDNKLRVWGGLSVVRGGNIRIAEADRLQLYTDPDGSYIEADANFTARISEGSPGLAAAMNGKGISAFMGADYSFGKSTIGFSLSDLGFISWDAMKTYSADGIIRFEGKEIENIFSFNDTLLSSYKADSLAEESGIDISDKKFLMSLPTFIKLTYVYIRSPELMIVSGLEYRAFAGSVPLIYLKPVFKLSKNLFINTTLMYGGFGRFDFDLGLVAGFGPGISAYVNINAMELLLLPDNTGGAGLSLGIFKSL